MVQRTPYLIHTYFKKLFVCSTFFHHNGSGCSTFTVKLLQFIRIVQIFDFVRTTLDVERSNGVARFEIQDLPNINPKIP